MCSLAVYASRRARQRLRNRAMAVFVRRSSLRAGPSCMPNTVVMIPGAFCGGWCFADFVPVFAERGWKCITPDLRFHVAGKGADPDPRLAGTSIADYTRDMAQLIEGLDAKPVLIGHSM